MTYEEALEIIKEEYQYRRNLLAEYYEHYCKQAVQKCKTRFKSRKSEFLKI